MNSTFQDLKNLFILSLFLYLIDDGWTFRILYDFYIQLTWTYAPSFFNEHLLLLTFISET